MNDDGIFFSEKDGAPSGERGKTLAFEEIADMRMLLIAFSMLILIVMLILLSVSEQNSCASLAYASSADEIPIFNNKFVIETHGNTESPRFIFIAPHYNERIGANAVQSLLESWKSRREAVLCIIGNRNPDLDQAMKRDGVDKNDPPDRYLYFSHENQWYCLDPNRIFTRQGIEKEIILWDGKRWLRGKEANKSVPSTVSAAVEKAANRILEFTGIGKAVHTPAAVVAVHNNSPTDAGNLDTFSLLWYKSRGPCVGEVAEINGAPSLYEGDPVNIDNLILVNRREDFEYLKRDGRFNVVLMKNNPGDSGSDDGSLSVYCGRKGLRYINVEARHMNRAQGLDEKSGKYQYRMLELVGRMLEEGACKKE